MTRNRLALAMATYAVLAILAGLTLTGYFRYGVWIFLAGLAVKTWLATIPR